MKIAIDARCLEEEQISGVGEYALEIIKHLPETDKKNQYIIFSNARKCASKNFLYLGSYSHVKLKRLRIPNKLLNFFLWYLNYPKLDKLAGGADVFFAPNINFLTVSKQAELVVTFHDLSFELHPEFFSGKAQAWHHWFVNPRRVSRLARRIIAVSLSTAEDLEEKYTIPQEKKSVVYHGISKDFRVISPDDARLESIKKKYSLPKKFILFLGNIEPRKNVLSLIMAYNELAKQQGPSFPYKLVLAGAIRSNPSVAAGQNTGITALGYVPREERPYLYNLASLVAYPSHFEGFGLPLLEAMACGTPVVAANNSSMPEIAGDAAIFVNPSHPSQILEAMRSVLADKKLQNTLRQRGLKRSGRFSWKKSAEQTLEILTNSQAI